MKRLIKKICNLFSLDGYALAGAWKQLAFVLALSLIIIALFGLLLNSTQDSYLLFMSPVELNRYHEPWPFMIGLADMLLGIMLGGFIISIMSSALVSLANRIRKGSMPYRGSGHIVLINTSQHLHHILQEIDIKAKDEDKLYDVITLFPKDEELKDFHKSLETRHYPRLRVLPKTGDLLRSETYDRLNLHKVFGIGILLSKNLLESNAFNADNFNLMVLNSILNNEKFIRSLKDRSKLDDTKKTSDTDQENTTKHEILSQYNIKKVILTPFQKRYTPIKSLVEVYGTDQIENAATCLQHKMDVNDGFTVFNFNLIISRILSRSIIDPVYLDIFRELLSFNDMEIYFINPKKLLGKKYESLQGKSFDYFYYKIKNCILIGFSRLENNEIKILLNPWNKELRKNEWFIIIAKNEHCIYYKNDRSDVHLPKPIHQNVPEQPSEIEDAKVCMLGKNTDFTGVLNFISDSTKKQFKHYEYESEGYYLKEEFLQQINNNNYDRIILNLKDEVAYRLTLMIMDSFPEDSPIVENLVIVLENPETEALLSSVMTNNNQIILSGKIAGEMITQLLFQKNLYKVIEELTTPQGNELNMVDASCVQGIEKEQIKSLLYARGMLYVGVVNRNGSTSGVSTKGNQDIPKQNGKTSVVLDADDFSRAERIIVLCSGEIN